MLPDAFHTARLVLRPITPEDAGPIFATYAQDPAVTRFLTWRPHTTMADTHAYIAHCLSFSPDVARTYGLTGVQCDGDKSSDLSSSAVRGAVDLRLAAPHRLEFGFVLARNFWNQGLMPEALSQIVLRALAQPGIFRIGSVCDVENTASARVMEKSGLSREGLLRRWLVHPNISEHPRDCFVYARAR